MKTEQIKEELTQNWAYNQDCSTPTDYIIYEALEFAEGAEEGENKDAFLDYISQQISDLNKLYRHIENLGE